MVKSVIKTVDNFQGLVVADKAAKQIEKLKNIGYECHLPKNLKDINIVLSDFKSKNIHNLKLFLLTFLQKKEESILLNRD